MTKDIDAGRYYIVANPTGTYSCIRKGTFLTTICPTLDAALAHCKAMTARLEAEGL